MAVRRVGAHLAVGAPPRTVRAPLDAYGSTSDNAERADFQRGQPRVAPESEFGVTCDTDDLRSFLELRRGKVAGFRACGISSYLGHEDAVLLPENGRLDLRSGAA